MSRPAGRPPDWKPVELEWVSPDAGGRAVPPTGPLYLPTARYPDDPVADQFSVGIRFAVGAAANGIHPAELAITVPDNQPDKVARLVPGASLVIHEGRREVARVSVVTADRLQSATT